MPFYDYRCELGCKVVMCDVLRPISTRDDVMLCPDCMMPMVRFQSVSSTKRAAEDNIAGGVWLENYGPNPIKVYSHTERRRLLKYDQHGMPRVDHMGREYQLSEAARHVGVPGTDRSPHTVDWSKGSIDPYTLEAARALVSRSGAPPTEPEPTDRDAEANRGGETGAMLRPFNERVENLTEWMNQHGVGFEDL